METIRSIFEHELGRLMTPMENEILENWKSQGFKDDTIRDALKEARFNGANANSYKYINKILQNWKSAEGAANAMSSQNQESTTGSTNSVEEDDLPWL